MVVSPGLGPAGVSNYSFSNLTLRRQGPLHRQQHSTNMSKPTAVAYRKPKFSEVVVVAESAAGSASKPMNRAKVTINDGDSIGIEFDSQQRNVVSLPRDT